MSSSLNPDPEKLCCMTLSTTASLLCDAGEPGNPFLIQCSRIKIATKSSLYNPMPITRSSGTLPHPDLRSTLVLMGNAEGILSHQIPLAKSVFQWDSGTQIQLVCRKGCCGISTHSGSPDVKSCLPCWLKSEVYVLHSFFQ